MQYELQIRFTVCLENVICAFGSSRFVTRQTIRHSDGGAVCRRVLASFLLLQTQASELRVGKVPHHKNENHWFSKRGPTGSSGRLTWALVRDQALVLHHRPPESETLGQRPRKLCVHKLAADSAAAQDWKAQG